MSFPVRTALLAPAPLLAGLLGACTTARMPVPPALASAPRLAVEGRQGWHHQQFLRFGRYEARDIRRSWTRGSDLQLGPYESGRRRQTFDFTLAVAGSPEWRVEAGALVQRRSVEVIGGVEVLPTDRSTLTARFTPAAGDGAIWTLDLAETRERPLAGTLTDGKRTWRVRGTGRLEGGLPAASPGLTSGYVIETEAGEAAAVEVLNDGAVWLAAGLPAGDADVLAAAAGVLLLAEELRATLPDG